MSWAARRRLVYLTGIVLFFLIVVGGPIFYVWYTSIPPACPAGTERPPGVADGPCPIFEASALQPEGVLWARSFNVRPGVYDAVAYIDNPNQNAGAFNVPYELDVYDDQNALIQDVTGTTFIMPGGVTPVFVGNIQTGSRTAVYTQFQFTSPLTWERVVGYAQNISVSNEQTSETASSSAITADVTNTSVAPLSNITIVATVFDPSGNAIATSQTALQNLGAGETQQIFFTWPSAFSAQVGRVDILPVVAPTLDPAVAQ